MDNAFTVCFYGSSDYDEGENLTTTFDKEIDKIINLVLSKDTNHINIITGGYGGIMDLIAKKVKTKKTKFSEKNIEVIGITCDAYELENPEATNYNSSNDLSSDNDIFIQAKNFANRIQTMIELSDLFIVLPGKQGSLSELLLTYDSYNISGDELKNKKIKIFVHEYWIPLLEEKLFFRKFNKNIISYFNSTTLENLLGGLQIEKVEKDFEEDFIEDSGKDSGKDIKEDSGKDFIKNKFEILKSNINKVILGRRYSTDLENILGLDFGWFYKNAEQENNGAFLSHTTKRYKELTSSFFTENNSVMLSSFENIFRWSYINGKLQPSQKTDYKESSEIPKQEKKKKEGDFDTLDSFFNSNEFGKTLIWKGFKIKRNTENSKESYVSENDIIFSVFLLLNCKIPAIKIGRIRQLIDDFLLNVSSTKIGELFHEKEMQLQNQALRAAISQVMARNGSHNIGSHVLNHLVRGLKDIDFNNLKNYEDSLFSLKDHHKENKIDFADDKLFLKNSDLIFAQLEYFNNYIKNRMEYLGDMAMNTPKMSSNLYLISDIFKDFDKVRLLLNNISGLGIEFKYKFNFIIEGENITSQNYKEKDVKLAIANDITGCQAFYNILENIIRNTAKHSKVEKEVVVIFTIELKTQNDDYYKVNIYDNIKKEDIDTRVKKQNEILNTNVLDEKTKSLRQNSLGMIEMDASAAYLRMLDISEINNDEYELLKSSSSIKTKSGGLLPILNANKFPEVNSEGVAREDSKYLGYQFYIPKPKEFLFIKNGKTSAIRHLKDIKKDGVDVLSIKKFKQELGKGTTYPHQFVITDAKFEDSILELKAQFSPRVLTLNSDDKLTFFQGDNKFGLIEDEIWKLYRIILYEKNDITKPHGIYLLPAFQDKDFSQITYNNHKFSAEKVEKKINALKNKENNNWISFEVLSSLAQSKLPNFNSLGVNLDCYRDKVNETIISKLFEAAQNKILVIDERIQQFSNELFEYSYEENGLDITGSISKYSLFQSMNVFMPYTYKNVSDTHYETFNFNLSDLTLESQLIDSINSFVRSKIKPDFLVIHYGILERIKDENGKPIDIAETLKAWCKDFKDTEIIITSGRTRIVGLPENVRFVNLAPLLSAFTDIRSKYSINKIINDARI